MVAAFGIILTLEVNESHLYPAIWEVKSKGLEVDGGYMR